MAGLCYYSCARNLKARADLVAAQSGIIFPDTEGGLCALPGIGPYTAAAIASIAFDRPAAVVMAMSSASARGFNRIDAAAAGQGRTGLLCRPVYAPNPLRQISAATMDLGAIHLHATPAEMHAKILRDRL